jgi:formylglycine-generating enzyme
MNRKNFSLKDIQLLSDHYSQAGNLEPVALFQIIQGFYPSGQTPESIRPVPFETLIEKIKASGNFPSLPEQTEDQKPWINSVRKKLNNELLALMSERGNPSSLSLDFDFTFIQFEGTTKIGPTTQHRKFKKSEITFNLPDELKAESETKVEKEKRQIEIAPDEDKVEKKPLEYDDALAKAEWPLAIRQHLGSTTASEHKTHISEYLYKFSEKWDDWIKVPGGKFLMGHPQQKDSAPHREVIIEKPFLINKYPVTNVEFYKFTNKTQYKTEAEDLIDAIVYHNGNLALYGSNESNRNSSFSNPSIMPNKNAFWLCPDGHPESLYGKHNHPVTQITWNDAKAFCKWKSETTGQIIRLPFEKEWEYVARNFGKIDANQFYWDEDRVVEFCNIEETGVCDTLPVDHFSDNEHCGAVAGLYGNVFEWVEDTKTLPENRRKSGSNDLIYKIARGGSFITHFKNIAPWRRISFIKSYCTSFLGFRTVCEDL